MDGLLNICIPAGAVCSRGSTEERSSGEEAERQPAPPAVDVLGGNPQAAQNVAGESPRHAPQPVAAAPRPVPPFTNPSTVPLQESNDSAFLGMENAPPTTLPETLSIISLCKDSASNQFPAAGVRVSKPLPTSLVEDCSSSTETQKLETSCPPLTSDAEIDSTVQELQYGSQTDKEKILSNSQTNQIQPPREAAGLVVITGTQSVTLEYKQETGTNMELSGKEHTGRSTQSCSTASSPSVPQSSVGFKVQDAAEHGAVEQSERETLIQANQRSHIPPSGVAEQAGGHQDSESSPPPLPSTDNNSEIKETDLSETQPQISKEISNDAGEMQNSNSLESVEMFVDTSHNETQPSTAEILENPKARESNPGSLVSLEKGGSVSSSSSIQRSCEGEEQTDISLSDFTMLPECSSSQQSSSKPSPAPPQFDTGVVVSLQAEEEVEAETSHSFDQIPTTGTQLTAQEIVVVREGAHISGDWSNMHLSQSYLVQQEDGSVCEAAIVNDLSSELSTGEPKLYEESVQADIEIHSQPVEVYEFCGLVEEVAEETVCASSSVQLPHSPGYEVNLFNALLENSDEHLESDTVIISQQPLPLSHDANQTQACSNNSSSHTLTVENTTVQHLVLAANPAGGVANSSEVCLVEVAAVTADSFTNEQVNAAEQTQVSDSSVASTVPQKEEAEATAGGLSLISPVVTSEDNSECVVENQTPGVPVVSTTVASQSIQNVPTDTKPEEASHTAHFSGKINPKLLLLTPGETPLLKHPPSLLAHVSKQQSTTGKLANAHSSCSGTVSEECLPQTVPAAADSLCASEAPGSNKTQTQCSVNKTPVTASGNISLHLDEAASAARKPDKEALTVTSTCGLSDPVPKDAITSPATPNTLYTLTASAEREGEAVSSGGHDDPVSQPDSLYMEEEEGEDMEQDEQMTEMEAQEAASGQVSSPEEGSDEDADADKTESEMTTPGSPHKVFL